VQHIEDGFFDQGAGEPEMIDNRIKTGEFWGY
jgi:hypothetical protein